MLAFNKNHALPASSQSSVDSLVTRPSTAASLSNAGLSQSSEASSYGDATPPDQTSGSLMGKRHSVFNLRSRSNTATSTTSSFTSMSPPRMGSQDNSSHRSLFRGMKGKRLSESFHDQEDSHSGGRRSSVLRRSRKQSDQSEGSMQDLKNRISSPFDFQHLTHTDRHQFAALQGASENDLVEGFKAVRASQAPRKNLNGIRADALHFQNFSSEDLSADSRSSSVMDLRSQTPQEEADVTTELPSPVQPESIRPSLRQTRSVESFSRPGVSSRNHRHTQSTNAPPRVSSRVPVTAANGVSERPDPAQLRARRQSNQWDQLVPLSPTRQGNMLPSMAEEPDTVGHALTTPDDSAIHTFTPPFSPGLEDVAEEPERFASPRPAPQPPHMASQHPRSPSPEFFSFSQQSSLSRSHSRKDSYASPRSSNQRSSTSRPLSQMSDTLGSPGNGRRGSVRAPPNNRRKSNTWRVIEESWEDDIDYIYDNALEAECDFDWGNDNRDQDGTSQQDDHRRGSAVTSHSGSVPSVRSNDAYGISPDLYARAFRPSLLVPSMNHLPDLDLRSATSASTMSVRTPSDFANTPGGQRSPFGNGEEYGLMPSLLAPHDYKDQVSRDEMYEDILAGYEDADTHIPLLEARQSSHTRASERSSYDSSMVSSGHGSGSWTTGVRRSGSSSGSLPELVHSSRAARRDMSVMVDQLTEQVASFSTLGEESTHAEEDDDVTPPGHTLHGRTFFTLDDEPPVVSEEKTSPELSRQGSKHSTRAPAPHHKYASSDGAAKMLNMTETRAAPASRNRAASSSAPRKQQYFSLFPSPPTHSGASSPMHPTRNS